MTKVIPEFAIHHRMFVKISCSIWMIRWGVDAVERRILVRIDQTNCQDKTMTKEKQTELIMEGLQKLFAGEKPELVVLWMTDRGVPYEEAKKQVENTVFKLKHGGRRSGLSALFKGGGLLLLAALLSGAGKLLGSHLLLPLLMAFVLLMGIAYTTIGVFQIVTNLQLPP